MFFFSFSLCHRLCRTCLMAIIYIYKIIKHLNEIVIWSPKNQNRGDKKNCLQFMKDGQGERRPNIWGNRKLDYKFQPLAYQRIKIHRHNILSYFLLLHLLFSFALFVLRQCRFLLSVSGGSSISRMSKKNTIILFNRNIEIYIFFGK